VAAALVVTGLAAAALPMLPGIPLIFGGLWLIAGVDGYRHIGRWWLIGIALLGMSALALDFLAGALGARRAGASPRAVWGALAGTLIGLFCGLPGVLLGPFVGALLGELSSGNSILRSTHAGLHAWLGLLFGTLVKLVCSLLMVSLFIVGWWLNRS
jgi:uncharacterized protein YqgC (DUF456 family)